MVKHATAVLKQIKETLKSDKVLKDLMIKSLAHTDEDEEQKEEHQSLEQIEVRVTRILDTFKPKKKIDKSKDFRSFMKT